jgi:hypothetical protein
VQAYNTVLVLCWLVICLMSGTVLEMRLADPSPPLD